MLKCSFCRSFGRRGWYWKRLDPDVGDLDAQFQCPLFLVVQALILGVLVALLDA